MSGTLGLSLTRTRLSGVLVRRGRIAWRDSVAIDNGETISDAADRLLRAAPTQRVFARRVRVVVGEAYAQVKELHGLPPTKHSRFASQVVRENAASFFALAGYRIVVGDVDHRSDGTIWGAAFAGDMVEQMLSSLSRHGVVRPTFLPALVALAQLATSGSHRTTDDGVTTTFTVKDGVLVGIARATNTLVSEEISLVPVVADAIVPADVEYLCAYAGGVAGSAHPFWRSPPPAKRTLRIRRAGLTLASVLCAAAAAAALVASGARAHSAIGRLSRELANTRVAQLEAGRTEASLRRVTAELERIERIQVGRGRTTLLLAGLSQVLPESTALISLRLDSLEGSFVALTPHAVDILPELSAVDQIIAPRIVGSVTRESLGSAQVERATIRFRTRKPASSNPRASTTSLAETRK